MIHTYDAGRHRFKHRLNKRAAVVELESSPEVAARCAALRTELRTAGGAAGAADVIEAEAARR